MLVENDAFEEVVLVEDDDKSVVIKNTDSLIKKPNASRPMGQVITVKAMWCVIYRIIQINCGNLNYNILGSLFIIPACSSSVQMARLSYVLNTTCGVIPFLGRFYPLLISLLS